MSSPMEPLFLPLILFGVVAMLYMLARIGLWLIRHRRTLPRTRSMRDTKDLHHALGTLLSSLLLWLGLLTLDSLALLYIFVQGDDFRVLSGRLVAVMLLAGSGLIMVAFWLRVRQRRALDGPGARSVTAEEPASSSLLAKES